LNELRIDADGLPEQQRFLLGLIETVAAGKNREARGNRTVEQVRLGKTELEASLQAAELRGESERFAEAQEVVGLISEADEAAGKPAYTAI